MVGATHFNAFSAAEDKETFIDAAITAANKFNTFFGGYKDIGSIQHTGQNMSKTLSIIDRTCPLRKHTVHLGK